MYSYLSISVGENPQLKSQAAEIICLSQLEILAKRNLRNFSYSTWHWACLATSFWAICPSKGKSAAAWQWWILVVQRWLCPRELLLILGAMLPIWGAMPAVPATVPIKQDNVQPAAGTVLPHITVFPGRTPQPGYMLLFPSLHRYICLHTKWPFWFKSKRFGLQCKQRMSHSLKHFTWLLPPALPPSPETWQALSAARGEGGPCALPVAIFSWKIQSSPALICQYKIAREEGTGREREGKANQTWDWWQGGARKKREGRICHKLWRNHTQHHPLPQWQPSPPTGLQTTLSGVIYPRKYYFKQFKPEAFPSTFPLCQKHPFRKIPLPGPSAW